MRALHSFSVAACGALLALSLPACSLLFDGSGYRGGNDAGTGGPDTGPISCSDPSMCPIGSWCDIGSGVCRPGCDGNEDCRPTEECNLGTHMCLVSGPCMTDLECGAGAFCDGGSCASCDGDDDGYAVMGHPSCLGPSTGLRPGDCDDTVRATHPFAVPDCDPTTNETCGTGSGSFSPDVFEIGLLGVGEVFESATPDTLRVVMLATPPGAPPMLIGVYQDASTGLPHYFRAPFDGGTVIGGSISPGELPGWSSSLFDIGGAVPPEQTRLSALRNPMGGAWIATAESGAGMVSHYAVLIDTDSERALSSSGSYRVRHVDLAGTVEAAALVIDDAANLRFGIWGTIDMARTLIAIDPYSAAPPPAPAAPFLHPTLSVNTMRYGYDGAAGGAFAGDVRSQIVWWNGADMGVAGEPRYVVIDSMTAARPAIASGSAGMPLGVVVGTAAGSQLSVWTVRCGGGGGGAGTCPVTAGSVPVGLPFGSEPLLTADYLLETTFLLAGIGTGTLGGVSLGVATLDVMDATLPTLREASVPLPESISSLTDVIDLDISTIATLMPTTASVDIGYAVATRSGTIDVGAVRVCSALSMP